MINLDNNKLVVTLSGFELCACRMQVSNMTVTACNLSFPHN